MIFECGNYQGLMCTGGDIDYLNAKAFIKPFQGKNISAYVHKFF